ncbi:squalene synthase HpnC [Undibacterium sp. SXout11W]|uniref:squalene synthase HpnC n=1 Tax=Undibacterium sp. SXout11W TaxID=3413050 RepID=UPI003BF1A327
MTVEHYENFPVASLLLPANLRPAVRNIYAFARTADDFADEGNATSEERIRALETYERELDAIETNTPSESSLFQNLAETIRAHQLPLQPFRDLLSAFKQDVATKRYATYQDLLDYCRRSANPIGTLMLHLYGAANEKNLRDSDAICSALQLINFWQDVAIDWDKQRIYIPQEDMIRFGISAESIANRPKNAQWQQLMQFQTHRARELMVSGSGLCKRLPFRLGWELRLVVQGGLRIAEKTDQVKGDIFTLRPKLQKLDWLVLLWRAIIM